MNTLIGVLGVSHKDMESGAAIRWLNHAEFLGTDMNRVFVVFTRMAAAHTLRALPAGQSWPLTHPPENGIVLEDECENGYPRSASHLFLRSLEWAEKNHPGSPVLWLECDTVPLHKGWLETIETEYLSCGSPFMGHLEPDIRPPHLAGCGVYPPNWRELAPSIASCHEAPDIASWGPGNGQAWDTYCAHEIYPQAVQARSIKQIWNCPPFTKGMMPLLEGVSLFHPSKDGRLIAILNGTTTDPDPIDLVYPVKAGGWWENELRWSLRSIEKHAGHLVRDVYVIGDKPDWYTGKYVPHESIKNDPPNPDQLRKLRVAVDQQGLSEDFLWMNNDFYCQHEPDFSLKAHMLGKPTQVRMPQYRGNTLNAMEILKWSNTQHYTNYTTDRDFELHVPMLMNKSRVREMFREYIPFGHVAFRTLYGNLFYKESVPMVDVKIRHWRNKPDPSWTWFSTDDSLFESRGSDYMLFMESAFPLPSRWELR